MFERSLLRDWWLLLLRGAVAILFGLVVIAQPAIGLAALVLCFGALTLLQGIVLAFSAFRPCSYLEFDRHSFITNETVDRAFGCLNFTGK